jgi:hypothetical protein
LGQECGPADPEEQEVMLPAELLSSTRRLLPLTSELPDRQNQQNQKFRPSFAKFTHVVRQKLPVALGEVRENHTCVPIQLSQQLKGENLNTQAPASEKSNVNPRCHSGRIYSL